MFYIEGIEAAARQAHARIGEHVTHGQITELLHMLEAIGIVKVGAPPAVAPTPPVVAVATPAVAAAAPPPAAAPIAPPPEAAPAAEVPAAT